VFCIITLKVKNLFFPVGKKIILGHSYRDHRAPINFYRENLGPID